MTRALAALTFIIVPATILGYFMSTALGQFTTRTAALLSQIN